MLKRILPFIFFLTLSACAQTTNAPTPLPTHPATVTLTLTATPSPTLTPIETMTPFPTLGSKPYLISIHYQEETQTLSMYDADGIGQKTIVVPKWIPYRGVHNTLHEIISPDGQWLVFYTGSIYLYSPKIEIPVTLKLLNLRDGTVKTVANIISAGYEEKIKQLAEKLKKLDPNLYKQPAVGSGKDDTSLSAQLRSILWNQKATVAWSPDSRTLAFAAQIDGNSLDVYLYNLTSGTVQQAEDSLQNVDGIRWSLDGKKIIFSDIPPTNTLNLELYVINFAKKVIKNPKIFYAGTWRDIVDASPDVFGEDALGSRHSVWLSPNLLPVMANHSTDPHYGIEALNIDTGQITSLWGNSFSANSRTYAIDTENKITTINAPYDENAGLYFVTFAGHKIKILEGVYWLQIFFRGGKKDRFLVMGSSETHPKTNLIPIDYGEQDVAGLDLNGKLTTLGHFRPNHLSISPDYAWLVMFDKDKLYLYDANDELVKTFPIPDIQQVTWRPDSKTIFYANRYSLYTMSIADGESRLVNAHDNLYDFVWVP